MPLNTTVQNEINRESEQRSYGPIAGLLIKLVFAQQFNNQEVAAEAAKDLGRTGNPQLLRAATQFLGSSKYNQPAQIALHNAPEEACKDALLGVIRESSNPLKRNLAISILGERQSSSNSTLIGDCWQTLSPAERQCYIASWLKANPLHDVERCLSFVSSLQHADYQNCLTTLVRNTNQIDASQLNALLSIASNTGHSLHAASEELLRNLGSRILPADCSQCGSSARTILTSPNHYSLSTLEIALTVFNRIGLTPTREILLFALNHPQASETLKNSLALASNLPDLSQDERLSVARRRDEGEAFGNLAPVARKIFEQAILNDGFDALHLKTRMQEELSWSSTTSSEVAHMCSLLGESLFDGPKRVEAIVSALRNEDSSICELGHKGYENSTPQQKTKIIDSLLTPGFICLRAPIAWAMEELKKIDEKAAIQKAIDIERHPSDSGWQNKIASEFLHEIALSPSFSIIRDKILEAGIVPSEHSYRTLSWPALCMIEHTLHSAPLQEGNVILLPSRIVGDPGNLLERGFKFGNLYENDVNQIETVLPNTCVKCVQVESSFVYVSKSGFPIARIFIDSEQQDSPLVLEAFPYSETDIREEVKRLVDKWLKPPKRTGEKSWPEYSLEHLHGTSNPKRMEDDARNAKDRKEREAEKREEELKRAHQRGHEIQQHLRKIYRNMELKRESLRHRHDHSHGIDF